MSHRGGQRQAFYFRLRREYDRTGTFNLGEDHNFKMVRTPREKSQQSVPLAPATPYQVRLGSLTLDDTFANDAEVSTSGLLERLPPPAVWTDDLEQLDPEKCLASFTTFPAGERTAHQLRFLLGSCRYPGLLWKRKHSDRIFGPMLKSAHDAAGARFVLMVGDQIYADMFHRAIPIGLADTYEEFQERYHSAFGSRNMRRLLRHVTTYMILDDHEIEDNWAQDCIWDRKKRMLFNVAIGAYCSYQWTHSPRNFGMRLHYSFECAGYPFFVLDGRTQRFKEDRANVLKDNHLLGRPSAPGEDLSQLEEVCRWLRAQQRDRGNAPKFIVSASVFVPNNVRTTRGDAEKNDDDGWAPFPTTRREAPPVFLDTKLGRMKCPRRWEPWFVRGAGRGRGGAPGAGTAVERGPEA